MDVRQIEDTATVFTDKLSGEITKGVRPGLVRTRILVAQTPREEPVTRLLRGLLTQLLLTLALAAHAADEHSTGHSAHKNHLALIVGHAEEEDSDGHRESGKLLGGEYLRMLTDRWSWGVIAETEAFGSDHERQGILAVPFSYFPTRDWRLFAAPGIEFRERGDPEHFMFRIGTGYQFRLGERVTLSPEIEVDFVSGGTRVFVFALALGYGF